MYIEFGLKKTRELLAQLEGVRSEQELLNFLKERNLFIDVYIDEDELDELSDAEFDMQVKKNDHMSDFICNILMHVDMEQYAKDAKISLISARKIFNNWAKGRWFQQICPYQIHDVERFLDFSESKDAWKKTPHIVSPHDLYDYIYAILMTQEDM